MSRKRPSLILFSRATPPGDRRYSPTRSPPLSRRPVLIFPLTHPEQFMISHLEVVEDHLEVLLDLLHLLRVLLVELAEHLDALRGAFLLGVLDVLLVGVQAFGFRL